MAAPAATAAHAELISSLSQDEIPIKLRCAICSRLAVNAFRLPCCEQAICETCQSTLPSSCPVCEHTPVAAEDCKPNKSLRTTIKVFLRTEEKKREAIRSKEAKNSPQPTVPEVAATPADTHTPLEPAEDKPASPAPAPEQAQAAQEEHLETPHTADEDIPQPSIEEVTPGNEPDGDIVEDGSNQMGDVETGGEVTQANEKEPNDETVTTAQAIPQMPVMGAGMGFDMNAANAFPGMGFGGDFNQMQMMMAMQNGGMGPNSFGGFPMMGMPGITMDPMAMQNMFMNGGFGAGMNGMNMNMGAGMGGFDGGSGSGFNNEWNGQQSWNVGQDNFNPPNAAGMDTGDYGSNNSSYNSHAPRYNQGNYGHGNQYNSYGGYGYQSRGRGRGRGGYGRGGYAHHASYQAGSGEGFNRPNGDTGLIPTGPKADSAVSAASNVDEFGREIRQTSEAKDTASGEAIAQEGGNGTPAQDEEKNGSKQGPSDAEDHTLKPIQTLDEAQGFSQNGYNGPYNPAMSRGYGPGFAGRGGYNPSFQPVKPADVPVNAPTGPKAMRDGLPNTGLSGLRVRGYQAPGIPNQRATGSASAAPEPKSAVESEKTGQNSVPQSRERSREPRSRSRSRSGDRRSRSRDRRHHRHRHRSASASDDEKDSERRRERRKERHRRSGDDDDDHGDAGSRERYVDSEAKDIDEGVSRSVSPSDSRRTSHRSRRDKDKYRERDRDPNRDHKSSSHKHRRHHDEGSRSRERDREHRHRHSRHGSKDAEARPDRSVPPTPTDPEAPSGRPSAGPDGAIETKGSNGRGKPTLDEIVIPTGPRQDRISSAARERGKDYDRGKENRESRRYRDEDESRYRSSRRRDSDRDRDRERTKEREREKDKSKAPPTAPTAPAAAAQDPHTLEREARNRERLLKEAQRIAGLNGTAGVKRPREDDDGRKGRKKGRRGDEGDEARLARLEAERESARWN